MSSRTRTPKQEDGARLVKDLMPLAAVMREQLDQHWRDVHQEVATNISDQVKQMIGQLHAQNPADTEFAMADVEHYIRQTAQTCVDEVEFWLPEVGEEDSLTSHYFREINS